MIRRNELFDFLKQNKGIYTENNITLTTCPWKDTNHIYIYDKNYNMKEIFYQDVYPLDKLKQLCPNLAKQFEFEQELSKVLSK